MPYHQCFDRQGNPVARSARAPLRHRIIQTAGLAAILAGLWLMGGRS